MTPIWLEMGRHPTVLDNRGGVLHRIPLRISPDRSNPLNFNFFLTIFLTKNQKKWFSGRTKNTPARNAAVALEGLEANPAHRGPRGPCGAFREQFRPMWRLSGAIPAHVEAFGSNSSPCGGFRKQFWPT